MFNSYIININSPLEQFEIINLFGLSFPIINYYNISITNLGFYTIITTISIIILHIIIQYNKQIVPNRWIISIQSVYASVHELVKSQIGQSNGREIYLPFIYSIFIFVLFANLNGNIPYGFTITTSIVVSIGFSIIIFIGVTIIGLIRHGIHFFSFFVPSGTPLILVPLLVPIEIISYISRAFSLGIRLFANIVAGHTLLKILSGFLIPIFTSGFIISIITLLPFTIFVGLIGLELAVSFIQSYVINILICSYIKDAIDLHLI